MKSLITFLILCFMIIPGTSQELYKSKAFTLYSDKVVQGEFEGKAISSAELISNYKSPANEFQSPAITFKFSINGKDNEMKPGVDHLFNCISVNGINETPILVFGQQYVRYSPHN